MSELVDTLDGLVKTSAFRFVGRCCDLVRQLLQPEHRRMQMVDYIQPWISVYSAVADGHAVAVVRSAALGSVGAMWRTWHESRCLDGVTSPVMPAR